ncbi:sugar ABC transporter permease [Vallitaleaceae bacterium 9-2]
MDKKVQTSNFRERVSAFMDKDNTVGYVFILPWLIGFFAFTFIPVIASLVLSFTKYDLLSPPTFIGLKNYITMFTGDALFIKSVKITFTFVAISVPLRLIFALLLAMVFNKPTKLTGFYRAVYYIPSIVGGSVAIAVMWSRIFDAEGAVNTILMSLGILKEPLYWLGNPKTTMVVLVLLYVWQFGSAMLIFLAGLKQIPISLYESAKIDGANKLQQFFKITIPMLTPIILFNLIMQVINGFMMFTQAFVLTNGTGGPLNSLLVYSMYMYRKTFEFYQMGYGSAMAWFMLIVVSIMTGIIFKTSNQWVFYEAKED